MHMEWVLPRNKPTKTEKEKRYPEWEAINFGHQTVQKEMPEQPDSWPELDKLPKAAGL